jgi:TonB family protein
MAPRPRAGGPRWDKGVVEGLTYKNTSLGLELTPAPGLKFGAPELDGDPGTVPQIVKIAALGELTGLPARDLLSFYADALAYYPENRRSSDDYMRRVVVANRSEGFWPPERPSSDNKFGGEIFGGEVFTRQDFQKGVVYEAVLVKACGAEALVFIFAGPNRDAANKLIATTELKLDAAASGCNSNAVITQDKPSSSLSSTTPSSDGQIYRVSPDVKPPRAISNPEPDYPQEARKGHAGKIVISMIVGSDGQPRDVKVDSGISPELDQATLGAVEKWRFQPGTKDGKPVPVKIAVEFDFRP